MTRRANLLRVLNDPRAEAVLDRLHAAADRQTPSLVRHYLPLLLGRGLRWNPAADRFYADKFIPVEPGQGAFCYLTCRALGARTVVEFGTSFGISTVYLALAVRDNGGGRVVGTELVPEKAARAREHLKEAGVAGFVEVREGDARETLRELPGPADFLLNDGFPPAALDVLKLVAPRLRPGAVVVTDNVGVFKADYAGYTAWVRDPANGFRSGPIGLKNGTEYSVRVAGAAG
ncbi:MAG: class I SAM-dependent methyltransferase [Gemmataceae bacterium]|nr:class I SAM-dependent methyltransferase [Gemmataceae bacterium]